MIAIGMLAAITFWIWYGTTIRTYSTILYLFLTLSIAYKVLRVLIEWYYLFNINIPTDKPIDGNSASVDMLTTYCPGEPKELVKRTLLAMKSVTYPHETILCCEGPDEDLESFCQSNEIQFVFRTDRTDAKAGNINNALSQTSGDLCVILDPDHIPFPDFLDEVVPHFDDPELGFVQVVQAYHNHDDSFVAAGAAEQTYFFYGPMMMGMNGQETVQAIGANCTFRRTALDSINGHAAGLTEDMHTSMLLHAKGWKSKYLPKIVAKGQVPSSFSAFIKQQIKWSRGSFDLLRNVYPTIFSSISLKQKIYYLTICMYFLIGLITFIDFSIPVASLIMSDYPIITNLQQFIVGVGPMVLMTFLIRVYSKKWLLEDHERRLFWKSGFLVMASWYGYLAGFIYTIFNKKVPYIPTIKSYDQDNEFKVHLPNIIWIGISSTAVFYGLIRDLTPFSIMMSLFAFFNITVLTWVIVSSQGKWMSHTKNGLFNSLRSLFTLFNQLIVRAISPLALLLSLFCLGYLGYHSFIHSNYDPYSNELNEYDFRSATPKTNQFLTGIYHSYSDTVNRTQSIENGNLAPFYVAWGDADSLYPRLQLEKAVEEGMIPMITWEPWASTFEKYVDDTLLNAEQGIFEAIIEGRFDFYLDHFSNRLNELKGPVFIRFAHEMGNPQYPWSKSSDSDYILAWQYVHTYLAKKNPDQLIWVWNPWNDHLSHFPGKEYVDWVGYTMLNYGDIKDVSESKEFIEMYQRYIYLNQKLKKPVMLAEFGSTSFGVNKTNWISSACTDIATYYPEIAAVVFFNSSNDKYWPKGVETTKTIDWSISQKTIKEHQLRLNQSKELQPAISDMIRTQHPAFSMDSSSSDYSSIEYNVDDNWRVGNRPLTRKQLVTDFQLLKSHGYNSIFRKKVDLYSYNVYQIASETDLVVDQGFDLSPSIDYASDNVKKDSIRNAILSFVQAHKTDQEIRSWVMNFNTYGNLKHYFAKPYLYQVQSAYNVFISELKKEILEIDSNFNILLFNYICTSTYSDSFNGYQQSLGYTDYYNNRRLKEQNSPLFKILNSNNPYLEGMNYEFTAHSVSEVPEKSFQRFEWVLYDDGIFALYRKTGQTVNIYIPKGVRGNLKLRLNVYTDDQMVYTVFKSLNLE